MFHKIDLFSIKLDPAVLTISVSCAIYWYDNIVFAIDIKTRKNETTCESSILSERNTALALVPFLNEHICLCHFYSWNFFCHFYSRKFLCRFPLKFSYFVFAKKNILIVFALRFSYVADIFNVEKTNKQKTDNQKYSSFLFCHST